MKAVLVIEMPKTCDECPLHVRECLCDWCVLDAYDIDACPLKPLPTKITTATLSEREQERTELFTSMAMLKVYADGYNACLKEIEGD